MIPTATVFRKCLLKGRSFKTQRVGTNLTKAEETPNIALYLNSHGKGPYLTFSHELWIFNPAIQFCVVFEKFKIKQRSATISFFFTFFFLIFFNFLDICRNYITCIRLSWNNFWQENYDTFFRCFFNFHHNLINIFLALQILKLNYKERCKNYFTGNS